MVSAADIEEFRDILKNKIMKIKGVKSTVSSIVLKAHKGPKCVERKQRIGLFTSLKDHILFSLSYPFVTAKQFVI